MSETPPAGDDSCWHVATEDCWSDLKATMDMERLIPIRRPPVLSTVAEPWVPEDCDRHEVESQWAAIVERNPRAFDGQVLHVLGVHRNGAGGVSIHVAPCAYRYYAVQSLGLDCGVRVLGAKAITMAGNRILLGLRADWLMYYAGLWEFVPGGSVQPGQEPAETILEELREETNCLASGPPIPVAVAYDPFAYSWEVVHRIELKPSSTPVGSTEYDALKWCERDSMPGQMTPIAQRMTSLMEGNSCRGSEDIGEVC